MRRSTRISRPYLNKYECYHTSSPYPISSHISYNRLSNQYKTFILQVSFVFEPTFYHQTVKYLEWRKAMAEELKAMEDNHT